MDSSNLTLSCELRFFSGFVCYDASVISLHASTFQESDERHCYIHNGLFYAFSYMEVGSSAKNGEREACGEE